MKVHLYISWFDSANQTDCAVWKKLGTVQLLQVTRLLSTRTWWWTCSVEHRVACWLLPRRRCWSSCWTLTTFVIQTVMCQPEEWCSFSLNGIQHPIVTKLYLEFQTVTKFSKHIDMVSEALLKCGSSTDIVSCINRPIVVVIWFAIAVVLIRSGRGYDCW